MVALAGMRNVSDAFTLEFELEIASGAATFPIRYALLYVLHNPTNQ